MLTTVFHGMTGRHLTEGNLHYLGQKIFGIAEDYSSYTVSWNQFVKVYHYYIRISFKLKPHFLSESKYSSENETYKKVVAMKSSPKVAYKIFLQSV